MKGLVVEKQARCTIVLTPTGEYKKIHGTVKGDVGQEVTVRPWAAVSKAAVLAAVLLIAILLPQAFPVMMRQNEAYAYVTLDINPSAEFAIDADYTVLNAHPYNQEAELILASMEYQGKGIGTVLAGFTQSAISRQYIGKGRQNHVVVSFYSEHTEDKQSVETELVRITEAQRQVLMLSGQEADINTVIIDTETRKEARKLGISAGRLEEAGQENGMGKDSWEESVPAGEVQDSKNSPNHKNEEMQLEESRKQAGKNKADREEKKGAGKGNSKNTKGKQETGNNALKGNFKQVRKEEIEKPFHKNNGKKAGLNGENAKSANILKGESGRSKEAKQKGDGGRGQGKKINTDTSKRKKNTGNKGMQKSGQKRKPSPVFKA